jgi:hypothetical protein
LLACIGFGQSYSPEQPSFSASPQALQEAFAKLPAGAHPVTILLEEGRYEYDSDGRQTLRYRTIFKVLTKAGAENWAIVERNWAPWKEQRPSIRAQVVAKDGTVHELDPKTIADSPAREKDDDVLSDERKVRAPLPAMEPAPVLLVLLDRQNAHHQYADGVLRFADCLRHVLHAFGLSHRRRERSVCAALVRTRLLASTPETSPALVTPTTLELANRGMFIANNGSTALMHTLAAVEAELDKPAEARASLLQRIDALGEDEPDDNDWYVFGRIAESYGLNQEAAAMYRRLKPPKDERTIPASSYALALRRLKAMATVK